MIATNQFKKGLKVEIDGVPYSIVEFQHVSPGKGSAFTRTKLRNMMNQNVTEKTFKSGDKVGEPNMEQREMQYMFKDAEGYHFMNTVTYDQVALSPETMGEGSGYLMENLVIHVMYFNERPIGIELPTFVELTVTRTDPVFRGDTVTGGGKPATLETGATVTVPFHITEGDKIRIDTRDNAYVEKVNK